MALILNIDTATETAQIGISENGNVLAFESNEDQMSHGAFVQPAIERILRALSINLSAIDAVAVSAGPGSYTGLRVGMASAKGICFALQKPLILINTLDILATASQRQSPDQSEDIFFCPMIDARRMEVYTALYDRNLSPVLAPVAMILDETSFSAYLSSHKIIFSGSGSAKFFKILHHPNAIFNPVTHAPADLASLSSRFYHKKRFADLAYSQPFYLKEFYTPKS